MARGWTADYSCSGLTIPPIVSSARNLVSIRCALHPIDARFGVDRLFEAWAHAETDAFGAEEGSTRCPALPIAARFLQTLFISP
jgi:hypothetical protein